MGRIRKWGKRSAGVPLFGRLRLPDFNGSGLRGTVGRRQAFKAKPSRAGIQPPHSGSGARFEAKPSRPGAGLPGRSWGRSGASWRSPPDPASGWTGAKQATGQPSLPGSSRRSGPAGLAQSRARRLPSVPQEGREVAGSCRGQGAEAAQTGQILDRSEPAAASGSAAGAALCGAASEAADSPSGPDPGEADRHGID